MTLYKFLAGMVFVTIFVATWSYFDAASGWIILLRAVICAVILQIGYFLAVVAMVAMSPSPSSRAGAEPRQNPDLAPIRGTPEDVPARRATS
ncbi:exopolysaccharide production repressor protein [Mesorhizobium sp. CAU 1732]|uniref:exopolysaccharide production repressor protein n=1 Tax=Mesorhizobium sp. CAU 1732 TaxID=3140358 RepID=UPI00325FFBEA